MLAAFERDATTKALDRSVRARVRQAVQSLSTAIQSEMLAQVLALYRYTRLQQMLMDAKGWSRTRAAQQLNPWIAAVYGEQGRELMARIKHNAGHDSHAGR